MSRTLDQHLIDAANAGDIEAVQRALLAGADIHSDDDIALRWASENGHTDVVDLLLKAGADVHAKQDAALQSAAHDGHLDVVDLLLKSGADIHADHDYALQVAAYYSHTDVVAALLGFGADATKLFRDLNIEQEQITDILIQHATTAYRGFEALMLLEATPRLEVLLLLHPELNPKQIRDELDLMLAMGLGAAQMAAAWTRMRGVAGPAQESLISP